jgi:hypothetical protein
VHPFTNAIRAVYPEPVTGAASVAFATTQTTTVRLTIENALGRTVGTIFDEPRVPGIYGENFDASALPAGIYVLALRAGSFSAIRRIMIVH